MAVKRSLLIAGAVSAVSLASIAGLHSVSAATSGQQSIVDKIAQKFNLNKSDVQQVFDEQHAERKAQHKTQLAERLDQAVKDGKLTEEQKTKVLAKLDEQQKERESERDSLKNMTPAQRLAAVKQHRDDLEQWAKDNGIPVQYLPFGGHGLRHGPGDMD